MDKRVLNKGKNKRPVTSYLILRWGVAAALTVLLVTPSLAAAADWTGTASLNTGRTQHTATLLGDGRVLVAGGRSNTLSDTTAEFINSTEIYNRMTNTWAPAAALQVPRSGHSATLLLDGRVLVAGGELTGSVELYDPAANAWSTAAPLKTVRSQHTATLLADGRVLVAGGYSNGLDTASAEVYDPASNTWTAAANMKDARAQHTATLLADGRVLVAGGFQNGPPLKSAELFDPVSGLWGSAAPMNMERGAHTATCVDGSALANKNKPLVMVTGGWNIFFALDSTELYDPDDNTWTYSIKLNTLRYRHTATLLPDKKLLVVGGFGGFLSYPDNAEVLDIGSGSAWVSSPSDLLGARGDHTATLLPEGRVLVTGGQQNYNQPGLTGTAFFNHLFYFSSEAPAAPTSQQIFTRTGHTATLLPDGRVLATGGEEPGGLVYVITDKAALYHPGWDSWSPAPSLQTIKNGHTATLLPDGRVLVAGGATLANQKLTTAEIYNPGNNAWSPAAGLHTARSLHVATLLADGRVLVVGGAAADNTLAGAEIYDPFNNTWAVAADPHKPRVRHTATLLMDGRVLVVGGYNQGQLAVAEIYDPVQKTWSHAAPMKQARETHTATLLADGRVLVVGGSHSDQPLASAEIYDPVTNSWKNAASPMMTHVLHTATLLPDGRVMVAGGKGGYPGYGTATLARVEIYDPAAEAWTGETMKYARFGHTATLLLKGGVLIAGGFGYPGFVQTAETVWCRRNDIPQPTVTSVDSPLVLGTQLNIGGTGFRDPQWNEASNGRNSSSATNFPLIQLRRLDNEQIAWLRLGAPFSGTSFTSNPVNNILTGPAQVTVFVNAVPGVSKYLLIKNGLKKIAIKVKSSFAGLAPIGSLIQFTAMVTSDLGIPTGAVQFQLDGADYGSPVALVDGEAVLSLATLPLGAHTVSAVYRGDVLFEGGAAADPLTQEIVLGRLFLPLISN